MARRPRPGADACGLLELTKALPISDPRRETYTAWAWRIVKQLGAAYLAPVEGSDALLLHAVYHMPNGAGVDEACIWGDYFYLEALMRLRRVRAPYWS